MFLGKQRQVKWAGLAVIAIAVLVFVSSPVLGAQSQIHFDIDATTNGSISWGGLPTDSLIGLNIEVDQVIGINTPLLSGTPYNLINGLLNFQTGSFVSYTSGPLMNQWEFGGGGSITLTGTADLPSLPDPSGTLMSGEFIYNGVVNLEHNIGTNEWLVTFASFNDDKNDLLLQKYGMPDVPYYGDFNISFEVDGDSDLSDGFTSTQVLSGDISNYPVPIPASALLLGSGIVGLIGFGKRMRK